MNTDSNKWFAEPKAAEPTPGGGELRLFCIPYAGGGTAVFRDWDRALPEVAIVPVRLPGREMRFGDPAPEHVDAIVDDFVPALAPFVDQPFALFGHSMGALIAFEVAQRLVTDGRPAPAHVFVAGRQAPHIMDPEPRCHALPDAELVDALRARYGSNSPAFKHPELIELMLPTLRADCTVCETYRGAPEPKLTCAITAIGGTEDTSVPPADLDAWRDYTTGAFKTVAIDGDHFFIDANRDAVLDVVRGALTDV